MLTQNLTMTSGFEAVSSRQKRKFPRLFLANEEQQLTSMAGVLLVLPDRTYLPVLGISSAGLMISPAGILSKIRLGQFLDCKVKFLSQMGMGEIPHARFRVIRLTSTVASLALDSLNFEERLRIEQTQKDFLIFSNIKAHDTRVLPANFREAQWWQGPFDTNFLIWKNKETHLEFFQKAIFEYDGIILTVNSFDSRKSEDWSWSLKKSVTTVDEARGYAAPWLELESQKISMGASWSSRLVRLLETSSKKNELVSLREILVKI